MTYELTAEDRQEFASGRKEKTQGASVAQARGCRLSGEGALGPHLKRLGATQPAVACVAHWASRSSATCLPPRYAMKEWAAYAGRVTQLPVHNVKEG